MDNEAHMRNIGSHLVALFFFIIMSLFQGEVVSLRTSALGKWDKISLELLKCIICDPLQPLS